MRTGAAMIHAKCQETEIRRNSKTLEEVPKTPDRGEDIDSFYNAAHGFINNP